MFRAVVQGAHLVRAGTPTTPAKETELADELRKRVRSARLAHATSSHTVKPAVLLLLVSMFPHLSHRTAYNTAGCTSSRPFKLPPAQPEELGAAQVCLALLESREDISPFIEGDFQEYVTEMADVQTWGGEPELAIAAERAAAAGHRIPAGAGTSCRPAPLSYFCSLLHCSTMGCQQGLRLRSCQGLAAEPRGVLYAPCC